MKSSLAAARCSEKWWRELAAARARKLMCGRPTMSMVGTCYSEEKEY